MEYVHKPTVVQAYEIIQVLYKGKMVVVKQDNGHSCVLNNVSTTTPQVGDMYILNGVGCGYPVGKEKFLCLYSSVG